MYLKTNSTDFDRSEILRAAHLSAGFYSRRHGSYRKALIDGMRAAWAQARIERTAFVLRGGKAGERPEVVAINRQVLSIKMKDRMTAADFAEVDRLQQQAEQLRAA